MRALFAALFVTCACFPYAGQCERPPDSLEYFGKLDAKAWKRLIERRIEQQAAGDNSPLDDVQPTWKDYWTGWYSFLRHPNPGLPWKGSEFKTSEDMIRHIKHRLKAHGLPTYEKT
jgi:hypothetical protein